MVIFFDIDDTLVNSESAHLDAIKIVGETDLFKQKSPDHIHCEWLNVTNKYLKLYFENKISLDQQRISRIKELWGNNGLQMSDKQAKKVYQQYHHLYLQSCKAFEDTVSCLQKLMNHKLGIISNGTYPDQIFKLEHNQIAHFFETIIISEKVGFSKPDKDIFQIAASQVGLSTTECIYVGNSYELDYLGSSHSGMKAIWLDRKNTQNNFECEKIHSLVELIYHPYFREEK